MRHYFKIERIVGGLVVQTYKPRAAGKKNAKAYARFIAGYMKGQHSWGYILNAVRVVNLTTNQIVAAYENVGGRKIRKL